MALRSSAGRRYAEAAFQLASRDDALDAWAAGLDLAARMIMDPAVLPIVDNPARSLPDRLQVLEKLLSGRVPYAVVRLASLLAHRGRVERIASVATEYRRLLDASRGIVEARVTSAAPLSPDETDAVRDWVTRRTGKIVHLSANVDETLIGGLTVGVGDLLMDGTVRGRLERLRSELVTGTRTA